METTNPPIQNKLQTRFSVDVKRMKLPLESVFKTINHSTVLPILEDVLVSRSKGDISFTSTDLENIMTVTVPDKGGKDFTCIFPGIELKYLIKNSIAETLDVLIAGKEGRDIQVNTGGFKLNLIAERLENYPKLIEVQRECQFGIDTKGIVPFLEKSLIFVSHDDLRPSMTGVCFRDMDGMINIATTDAHRLYWHPVCKTPKSFNKNGSFIISQKAARLIIQAFRTEPHIIFDLGCPYLQLWCEGKNLITRLMDATYPEFKGVIPTDNSLSFNIHRKNLTDLLRMCQPFVNKSTRQIAVNVSPDKIEISGGDVDFNMDFSYSLPVVSPSLDSFMPYTVGLNAKFLSEAIDCVKGEYIKFEHSMHPQRAIIVDECVLIMPLMLNA